MNIQPGKCIKCLKPIARGNAPLPVYREFELKTDNNIVLSVGVCDECTISESDWDEAGKAIQASLPNIPIGNITALLGIKNYQTIMLELQGGCCNMCGEKLGDAYVVNNGRLVCEFCTRDRAKVEKGKVEPLKKNPHAGKSSHKEEKRQEKKNVQMQDLRSVPERDSIPTKSGKGTE